MAEIILNLGMKQISRFIKPIEIQKDESRDSYQNMLYLNCQTLKARKNIKIKEKNLCTRENPIKLSEEFSAEILQKGVT